jgi:hypothetical protein
MKYIEAPNALDIEGPSIFIAGGITGTNEWQLPFIEMWKPMVHNGGTILNPRRKDFPMGDLEEGKIQIAWEQQALQAADAVSFWFPHETLCPITLFELGIICKTDKALMVGCHPEYQRAFDVKQQLSLYRPEVKVVDTLELLAEQVEQWLVFKKAL